MNTPMRAALLAILMHAATAYADNGISLAAHVEAKTVEAARTANALTLALRAAAVTAKMATRATGRRTDDAIRDGDCAVLQPPCAASLGAKLSVTHMLVGTLERRGSRFTLTLSLINVSTQRRVRSLRDAVSGRADIRRWGRRLVTQILDEGTGEIVIVANARRGEVLLDGLPATELFEGRATISGVALGRHELEVRAAGYRPFALEVLVDGRTEETLLLDPLPE